MLIVPFPDPADSALRCKPETEPPLILEFERVNVPEFEYGENVTSPFGDADRLKEMPPLFMKEPGVKE